MHNRVLRGLAIFSIVLVAANSALAQPLERLTFQQAIDRAIANNPTVARATEGILRAEAILQQVRSSSLPNLSLSSAVNFTNPGYTPSTSGSGFHAISTVTAQGSNVDPVSGNNTLSSPFSVSTSGGTTTCCPTLALWSLAVSAAALGVVARRRLGHRARGMQAAPQRDAST